MLVEDSIETSRYLSPCHPVRDEEAGPEDDPIGDFDDDSMEAQRPSVKQQTEQVPKKAPYVPVFNKGKGKATASNSPFQRASSAKVSLLCSSLAETSLTFSPCSSCSQLRHAPP